MKKLALYLSLLAVIVLLFIASLRIGIIHLQTPLWDLIGKHDGIDATTVWDVRFPRVFGAALLGAALGVAGVICNCFVVFQTKGNNQSPTDFFPVFINPDFSFFN